MKINDIRKLTQFKPVNLYKIDYNDRENKEKQWIFASRFSGDNPLERDRSRPDAVVLVPYHTHLQKLVLIREFRVALGDYQYGFPAGLLDPGESVETAGKRELFEETGLTVTKILTCSPPVFSSSGLTDESVSLMFVECEGVATNRYNEASEDIDILMVSPRQAEELMSDPLARFDVKTWIALHFFVLGGRL